MKAHAKLWSVNLNLYEGTLVRKIIQTVKQTVKHLTRVMIWSFISSKDTAHLYVAKGTMRQDQYKEVLKNRLIPKEKESFSNDEPFVFM